MKKTFVYILTSFLIALSLSGSLAYAATDSASGTLPVIPKPTYIPGPSETLQEEKNTRSILVDKFIPQYTASAIGFVSMLAFVFLVVAGVRFAVSYGNTEAADKARNQVIYALVGLLISLLAYSIVTIIINIDFTGG